MQGWRTGDIGIRPARRLPYTSAVETWYDTTGTKKAPSAPLRLYQLRSPNLVPELAGTNTICSYHAFLSSDMSVLNKGPAMYETVSFSWDELFEKVWAAPLLQLAREIGVSDVALGKACRKAKIPLPGRGYWAKPASERVKPDTAKLLDAKKERIHFAIQAIDEFAALIDRKREELAGMQLEVSVPDNLESPHRLVAQTLKLRKGSTAYDGRLRFGPENSLHVSISPDTFDRAMRILDALIKASESSGCRWSINGKKETVVKCNGESMSVVLKERLTKRLKPKPPEPVRPRRARWEPRVPSYNFPEYEWVSTNELTFCIDEYVDSAVRRNWADSRTIKLEQKLPDIVRGFAILAEAIKVRRHRLEERDRQWQREKEEKERKRRKAEGERILRARLVGAMEQWEQSERLQRFCEAAQRAIEEQGRSDDPATQQWLSWAWERALELNPLNSQLSDIATLQVKVPDWFKGLGDYESPARDWWTTPIVKE